MEMTLEEQVYYSLLGELTKEFMLPWVENAFASGSPCAARYAMMLEAYERLTHRLGSGEEDADAEQIINSLLENQKELCLRMFRLGVQLGQGT